MIQRLMQRVQRHVIENFSQILIAQGSAASAWLASWVHGYGWRFGKLQLMATVTLMSAAAIRYWLARKELKQIFAAMQADYEAAEPRRDGPTGRHGWA